MTTTEPRDPHERKCRDCGNIAIHEDRITPWVLCKKCGSQDTRATKMPPPTEVETFKAECSHLREQLACCADLVNSWCRETHIKESGSPYDGLELRDAVDRLWSELAGRLDDAEKEVERLRAAAAELAEIKMAWGMAKSEI